MFASTGISFSRQQRAAQIKFGGKLDVMLKIDKETLDQLEKGNPGIGETILRFEEAALPVCSRCRSQNTADVQCGIIGRTINVAAATTKFKLIANGPKPGKYFCNTCNEFFN